MTCPETQERLTAYLDGELDAERGTLVRGHLRTCAACRGVATEEAQLRDALRALPTVDPPAALWAGIQAQLATEEVAAARQPAWRRLLARWRASLASPWLAMRYAVPALAVGAGALAFAVHSRSAAPPLTAALGGACRSTALPSAVFAACSTELAPVIVHTTPLRVPSPDDVTASLAQDGARASAAYAATAEELLDLSKEARGAWSTAQCATFDREVATLRATIGRAPDARAEQRAYRGLIRYVQRAVVRDDVTLASAGGR